MKPHYVVMLVLVVLFLLDPFYQSYKHKKRWEYYPPEDRPKKELPPVGETVFFVTICMFMFGLSIWFLFYAFPLFG